VRYILDRDPLGLPPSPLLTRMPLPAPKSVSLLQTMRRNLPRAFLRGTALPTPPEPPSLGTGGAASYSAHVVRFPVAAVYMFAPGAPEGARLKVLLVVAVVML
jgi:hypothetical protein